MSTAALEKTFDIVRAMSDEQRASVINFVMSLQSNASKHRKQGSVAAAARRLAGSLAQYDDGKSYDEMRYEALKDRYGRFD